VSEKIVIFGIGNAGRAIYRKLKNEQRDIVGFIDNNTKVVGTLFDGTVPIFAPQEITMLEFDKVAVGGVWAESMQAQLLELGCPKEKIWFVEDDTLDFSANGRVATTDAIVKEFTSLMKRNNLFYCIEGSSLLCLLRGQNLSDVPDVDVLIRSQADLQNVWEVLQTSDFFRSLQLHKLLYKEDGYGALVYFNLTPQE